MERLFFLNLQKYQNNLLKNICEQLILHDRNGYE